MGLERDPQQAQYNQEDCSRQAGKGTDNHRYPVISDIGFSCILHKVKKIHDEQRDKTDDGVYHQMPDILYDIERDRQEDDNDQYENCHAEECHRWLNILIDYISLPFTGFPERIITAPA